MTTAHHRAATLLPTLLLALLALPQIAAQTLWIQGDELSGTYGPYDLFDGRPAPISHPGPVILQLRAAEGTGPYRVTAESLLPPGGSLVLAEALDTTPINITLAGVDVQLRFAGEGKVLQLEYSAVMMPSELVEDLVPGSGFHIGRAPSLAVNMTVQANSPKWLFGDVTALQQSAQFSCSSASSNATVSLYTSFASTLTGTANSTLQCDGRQMTVDLLPIYYLRMLARSSSNESILFSFDYQLAAAMDLSDVDDSFPVAFRGRIEDGGEPVWIIGEGIPSSISAVVSFYGPGLQLYYSPIPPPASPALQPKWFNHATDQRASFAGRELRADDDDMFFAIVPENEFLSTATNMGYVLTFSRTDFYPPSRETSVPRPGKSVIWRQGYTLLVSFAVPDDRNDPDVYKAFVDASSHFGFFDSGSQALLPAPLVSAQLYAYGPSDAYEIVTEEIATITSLSSTSSTTQAVFGVRGLYFELGDSGANITVRSVDDDSGNWCCWPLHEPLWGDMSNTTDLPLLPSFDRDAATCLYEDEWDRRSVQFRSPYAYCAAGQVSPKDVVVTVQPGLGPDPVPIIIAVAAVVVVLVVVALVVRWRKKRGAKDDPSGVEMAAE